MAAESFIPHSRFCEQLRKSPETYSLDDKRRQLRALGEALHRGMPSDGVVTDMLRILSTDASWEVRQDVAELLVYLPEPGFLELAAILSSDSNGYVCRSAERSIGRKRREAKENKRRQRNIDDIADMLDQIRREYSEDAVVQIRKLAEIWSGKQIQRLAHDQIQILTLMQNDCMRLRKAHTGGPPEVTKLIDNLNDHMQLLNSAVKDAEAYAHAQPHERHMEWFPDILNQAVLCAKENTADYGEKSAAITIGIEEVADIRLAMARQLIIQALCNVIKNGIEAVVLRPDVTMGEVRISAKVIDAVLLIEVRDNGHGMDSSELADRNLRFPSRNPRKKRSSGVGLMNAWRNVEEHEGSLELESTVGVGTTVRIRIPVIQAE